MPQYSPPLNVCFTHYLESCHHHPPSPFANILDLLKGRTSLKQLPLAGPALHIILPASNFQRRFAMFRDVMRVKTSAREGSREVYILREVS